MPIGETAICGREKKSAISIKSETRWNHAKKSFQNEQSH